MSENASHELERLFYPRNLAIVGASPKTDPMFGGNFFMEGAIKQNFQGQIFPVNPRAEYVLGYKAYPSIRDIPCEVDLVIFAVPFNAVLQVMEDCVARGVKFVHLFTAGFSETGRQEHAELERELIKVARNGGIRIVGPNCMGIYSPEGRLAFEPQFPTEPGPIGLFSQSGQLAGYLIDEGASHGLRYSKVVSFGNASDLQAHDYLNYFAWDEKTEIIGSYIEGLKDGWTFFETAKSITQKKPLVVLKGGQTKGGSRAIQSHTAAIAGSIKIWRALCKQAGIISVHTLDEFVAMLSALKRTLVVVSGTLLMHTSIFMLSCF